MTGVARNRNFKEEMELVGKERYLAQTATARSIATEKVLKKS